MSILIKAVKQQVREQNKELNKLNKVLAMLGATTVRRRRRRLSKAKAIAKPRRDLSKAVKSTT